MVRATPSPLLLFLLAAACCPPANAVEINNGVVDTNVRCAVDMIQVGFRTRNEFRGRIFVKGMVDNAECVSNFGSARGSTSPSMSISFGSCSMHRSRTLSPQRGMMTSIVVIVSFHPMVITKVDEAFRLQCFYMEAEKMVTAGLDVSMLTTDVLADTARMPTCSYTLRQGARDGPLLRFARVGQSAFHEWECGSETHEMLVKSCFVSDGQGSRFRVLDERGCSVDEVVLGELTYGATRTSAWVESHVFKFADRPMVLFECVIELCNRGQDTCAAITPPNCSLRRSARSAPVAEGDALDDLEEVDVVSNSISVLDLEDTAQHTASDLDSSPTNARVHDDMAINGVACFSLLEIGVALFACITLLFVAVFLAVRFGLERLHDRHPST